MRIRTHRSIAGWTIVLATVSGLGGRVTAQTVGIPAAPILLTQAPAEGENARAARQRKIALYRTEAEGYTIYRDSSRKDQLPSIRYRTSCSAEPFATMYLPPGVIAANSNPAFSETPRAFGGFPV